MLIIKPLLINRIFDCNSNGDDLYFVPGVQQKLHISRIGMRVREKIRQGAESYCKVDISSVQ